MSILAQQIQECMSGLVETGEDRLMASFLFPTGFIGFQGHFRDRPILPAMCEIQAAVGMLEAWKKERVRLNEIIVAKFTAPVTCNEEVVFLCSVTMADSHRAEAKVTVAKGGATVAQFKLRVTFQGEKQRSS